MNQPLYYVILLALIAIAVGYVFLATETTPTTGLDFTTVRYERDILQAFVSTISSLMLIALLIERSLEVFIAGSRGVHRAKFDAAVAKKKAKLAAQRSELDGLVKQYEKPDQPGVGAAQRKQDQERIRTLREDKIPRRLKELEESEGDLQKYRSKTRAIMLLIGIGLGLVAALSGNTVLFQIIESGPPDGFQAKLFNATDVVLTAGLLGGGASGIHELVSVFGDQMTSLRKMAQATAPKP